jgi:hypothetical protein
MIHIPPKPKNCIKWFSAQRSNCGKLKHIHKETAEEHAHCGKKSTGSMTSREDELCAQNERSCDGSHLENQAGHWQMPSRCEAPRIESRRSAYSGLPSSLQTSQGNLCLCRMNSSVELMRFGEALVCTRTAWEAILRWLSATKVIRRWIQSPSGSALSERESGEVNTMFRSTALVPADSILHCNYIAPDNKLLLV